MTNAQRFAMLAEKEIGVYLCEDVHRRPAVGMLFMLYGIEAADGLFLKRGDILSINFQDKIIFCKCPQKGIELAIERNFISSDPDKIFSHFVIPTLVAFSKHYEAWENCGFNPSELLDPVLNPAYPVRIICHQIIAG